MILGVTKLQALAHRLRHHARHALISTLSGLWGVLVTDLFQFVLKMGMVIVLAVYAVSAVGGMAALKEQARGPRRWPARRGRRGSILSFVPDIGSAWMPLITFFVYIAVNWWATWYPGRRAGRRRLRRAAHLLRQDEKHSLLATLWFNIAHYALRPWPWILIGLVRSSSTPSLADKESGFVEDDRGPGLFPVALRGLMLAAFAAAYMSTIGPS